MGLDISKGTVRLSDDLVIFPGYSFKMFKNTQYYCNQDGIRMIVLDGEFVIENRHYKASLCFRKRRIYFLELMCVDEEFTWETEPQRKSLHDRILAEWGLSEHNDFDWGKITSHFDPKGWIGSILIEYKYRFCWGRKTTYV